jgi:hypothetical protein
VLARLTLESSFLKCSDNGDLLRKVDRLNENIYLKKNENIYLNSLDPDGSISTDFSPGKIL